MILIWSGSGAMVAIASAGAGLGTAFLSSAIRGLLLWGVTGSQTADAPVLRVASGEPRFREARRP